MMISGAETTTITTGSSSIDPSSTTTTMVKTSSQQQQQQEKPLKMNTYIQLEIDQSNFNCLPRVCKFCVSKLSLNDGSTTTTSSNSHHSHNHHHNHHHHHHSHSNHHTPTPLNSSSASSTSTSTSTSVILAVKLQGSKRSFRTIEIPMHKTTTTTTTNDQSSQPNSADSKLSGGINQHQFTSVDLNLNYNITYPHFIKKDTNILYFYIQKKKKYKTKTILGYKTLAYTFIDLSTVLQRSFSDQLPLFFRTNTKTSNSSSSKSSHHHQRANVIGTLSIVGLVSQPVDLSIDLEYLTHAQATLGSDYSDNEIYIESNKHKKKTLKKKSRSSSHVVSKASGGGSGALLSKMTTTPNASSSTKNSRTAASNSSKKFTGKIIQFIRKLKNDNMVTLSANEDPNLNEEVVTSGGGGGNEVVVGNDTNNAAVTDVAAAAVDSTVADMPSNGVAAAATATCDDEEDNDEEEDDNEEQEADDDEQEAEVGEENENEDEEDLDDDEAASDVDEADLDEFYNIEQISDYTDSDDPVSKGPNYEPDTYSIVSTPKPKLQPFFTNTNTYFQYTGSQYNSTDLLKIPPQTTTTTTTTISSASTSNRNSKPNLEIPSTLVLRPAGEHHHHHHPHHHVQQNRQNSDMYLFYADESDPLTSKLRQALSQEPTFGTKFLLITSLADLARQFLIMNSSSNSSNKDSTHHSHVKLLLFANESYNVQKYVQNFYLEILVDTTGHFHQSNRIRHYVVMRRAGSFLGAQLARTSPLYQSLFADEWWSKVDWLDLHNATAAATVYELSSRFTRYMSVESTRELACQIGELMINQMSGDDLSSKFIPFLSEVRIGFPPDQIQDEVFYTSSTNSPIHTTTATTTTTTSQSARSSLSTSNSTPVISNPSSQTVPPAAAAVPQSSQSTSIAISSSVIQSPPQQQQQSSQNKPISIVTSTNQTPKSNQQQQQQQQTPQTSNIYNNTQQHSSPPNSPKISSSISSASTTTTPLTGTPPATVFDNDIAYNLQLDYWTNAATSFATSLEAQLAQIQHQVPQPLQQLLANYQQQHSSSSQKITQKAWFKSLHVFRTPHLVLPNTDSSQYYLTLVYQIKEKKQKIMRLSKKTKDNENKKEVEGLTRLVCTSKNHTTLLNVYVDDLEYDNIKFLQISSLWRGKATFFNFTLPSAN